MFYVFLLLGLCLTPLVSEGSQGGDSRDNGYRMPFSLTVDVRRIPTNVGTAARLTCRVIGGLGHVSQRWLMTRPALLPNSHDPFASLLLVHQTDLTCHGWFIRHPRGSRILNVKRGVTILRSTTRDFNFPRARTGNAAQCARCTTVRVRYTQKKGLGKGLVLPQRMVGRCVCLWGRLICYLYLFQERSQIWGHRLQQAQYDSSCC